MTQASRMVSVFALVFSIYMAMYYGQIPLGSKIQDDIIPVLPFWALISLGAYLLGKLGYGVLTFNDVPEAHKELMREIETARADLRKKGVEVD